MVRPCARCATFVSINAIATEPPPAKCEIEREDNPAMSDYFCARCTDALWREAEAADARAREERRAA